MARKGLCQGILNSDLVKRWHGKSFELQLKEHFTPPFWKQHFWYNLYDIKSFNLYELIFFQEALLWYDQSILDKNR